MTRDFDLFVIGGGSGGIRAARVAADHGARVALAEHDRVGGTCVIRGCVPKKLLVYGAEVAAELADAAGYGWRIDGARFDWPTLIAAKDAEIARLSGLYRDALDRRKVAFFAERARLVDPHTIEVGQRRVTTDVVLVATGGRPRRPGIPGIEHAITSNEAFGLTDLPRRVLIWGGGYIAVEFAGIFGGFGAAVTLLYRGDRVLRGFDEDVRAAVHGNLVARGVDVRLGVNVTGIDRRAGALQVTLGDGAALTTDAILCATGRDPNSGNLGLEALGVDLAANGAIVVDERSQTTAAGIYAVGDVTNRINLTPVALHEGHAFADTVFGDRPRPVDHDLVPSAVFCQPPVACVGLSEARAHELLDEVHIYRSTFAPLRHSLSGRREKTMIKLVVDGHSERVVGAHMVGDDAPEIIPCLAIPMKMGATKADFDRALGVHPTTAEELVTLRRRTTG
jgi:glutathione reductase (NADPH)